MNAISCTGPKRPSGKHGAYQSLWADELRQGGQFIPTLMLTARGHPDDVLRGFAAGADDYLTKPFELAILIARLSGLLRRRE